MQLITIYEVVGCIVNKDSLSYSCKKLQKDLWGKKNEEIYGLQGNKSMIIR